MDADVVRVRVLVTGRVQGVWFRQSTAAAMADAGVVGYVRNLDDGRVEAVVEGCPDAVAAGLAYVARGPERARVDHVEEFPEKPEGLAGFTVR